MAAYTVRVRARFEAAHHLRSYRGAPEPAHGHSWQVEAVVAAERLDAEGIAFDFIELKRALDEVAGELHHHDINTVPPFDRRNPTTEHVAAWFHERLTTSLPAVAIAEITVWEGPDVSATYRPAEAVS
jgi:6-pyruvoyltetrahydropterin/6-carboxytetrahydropterin synthase